MRKISIKRESAATFLYFASILWCLLFPLVNITSGETKPRGLYVDENALLTSSGTPESLPSNNNENSLARMNFHRIKDLITNISSLQSNICQFLTADLGSASCCQMKTSTGTITRVTVDHPWKARSLEVTVVVIPYHSTNEMQCLVFVAALMKRISTSDWLSKRIMILLLPLQREEGQTTVVVGEAYTGVLDYENYAMMIARRNAGVSDMDRIRFSASLSTWLNDYHAMHPRMSDSVFEVPELPSSDRCDDVIHEGLLRDAYIVDFSEPYVTTLAAQHQQGTGKGKGGRGGSNAKGKGKASWKAIRVLIAGNNGQLPNMDFIAAPLALFPHILITEAEQASSLDLMVNKILAFFPENLLQNIRDSVEGIIDNRVFRNYSGVVSGLLSFSGALVEGPTGLHGQFIRRNVDSLTLRPVPTASSETAAHHDSGARSGLSHEDMVSHGALGAEVGAGTGTGTGTGSEHTHTIEEREWAVPDLLNLMDIVEQCIRHSSNING
jgi:hypothetical protein